MFKIEKYLGLHDKVPEEKCWLKGDPYLVPLRNHGTVYRTDNSKEKTELGNCEEWSDIEQWLDFRWQRHKFRPIIKWVFYVEAFIALVLMYVLNMC